MALNINGTTGISGVDGSASAPAVTGTDSNTGINFGSDTVNINTGGSTRATVDSNGTFLLGATSYGGGGNNPALFVSTSSLQGVKFHKTGSGQSSLQLTCESGTGTGQGDGAGLQLTQEGTSSYIHNNDDGNLYVLMGGTNTILHRSNGTIRARSAVSGTNTATSTTVVAIIAKETCFAPLYAATRGVSPNSILLTMFSNITIASSTTIPIAKTKAINVKRLIEKSKT